MESGLFTEQAKLRAKELGVADRVKFIHGDAAGYVSEEKAGVAACVGNGSGRPGRLGKIRGVGASAASWGLGS